MIPIRSVKIADFTPVPSGKDQYAPEYIKAKGVIKLSDGPSGVIIGCRDQISEDLMFQLKGFHKSGIETVKISPEEFSLLLADLLSTTPVKTPSLQGSGTPDALDQLANNAPIINLVNSILLEALNREASDIHIECFNETAQVRYRRNGVLELGKQFPRDDFPAVSSRIKIMGDLNIVETRRPQDGRFSVTLGDRKVDIRVSIVPIVRGESLVLRILNRDSGNLLTLEELGFLEEDAAGFRSMYGKLNGLVLVTGPTGSGKTTTLNAALRELNRPERKIITIEDPVEFLIDGIDQIQTHEKIGLTFDSILSRILRQDPDIIMVGEIRDKKTAELAVRAALTGHLVFATLHTNDAVSAVNRLVNMDIPPYLLASVLRGALSQRLARRNCQECLAPMESTPVIQFFRNKYSFKEKKIMQGMGCKICSGTGYRGRVALLEWFTVNRQIEEMIVNQASENSLREALESKGMTTYIKDGLAKLSSGVLSFEELERTVLF